MRRAAVAADPDEFADAFLVEDGERVGRKDAERLIRREQLGLDVVTAEGVGHLREIVRAEREEVGVLGEAAAVSAARGVSIIAPTVTTVDFSSG